MKRKTDLVRFRTTADLGNQMRSFAKRNGTTLSSLVMTSSIYVMDRGPSFFLSMKRQAAKKVTP